MIGSRYKCSNALSQGVLIDQKLHNSYYLFSFECVNTHSLFRIKKVLKITLKVVVRQQGFNLDFCCLAVVAERNYLISIPNSEVKRSSAENTWTFGPGKIGHCQDFLNLHPARNSGVFIYIGQFPFFKSKMLRYIFCICPVTIS